MNDYALMDINTFASPPTQYEVERWLVGRGHVARTSVSCNYKDGRARKEWPRGRDGGEKGKDGGGARSRSLSRRSLHCGFPLENGKRQRAKLQKGHQRACTHGHYLSSTHGKPKENIQDRLQKETRVVEKDAAAAESNKLDSRHSRHMGTQSHRSGQGHRFSLLLQMLKAERNSVASSAGSGDTLVGSTASMESSSPSPTCMRFSAASFSKPTPSPPSPSPSPSLTCTDLSATRFSTPPLNPSSKSPYPTNLAATDFVLRHHTKTNVDHRSTPSAAPSRSHAFAHTTMDEKSRVHKALNAFRQCMSLASPLPFPLPAWLHPQAAMLHSQASHCKCSLRTMQWKSSCIHSRIVLAQHD